MADNIENSLDDYLFDGLSFKLAETATSVTSRRSCTFHAQGGNIYTPTNGTKLIKLLISGNDLLGPSTSCIMCFAIRIDGIGNQQMIPIGGPWPCLAV